MYTEIFDDQGDFKAMSAAEKWLRNRGFSIGSPERGNPRGLLHGDFLISKWRNLSAQEILDLHGTMKGNMRDGPIQVDIFDHAPADAIAAVKRTPYDEEEIK